MNVLIVNQFFYPDVAATSQLLTDLVRHIGERHNVTVICSAGRYDARQDSSEAPPAIVRRVPGLPFARGFATRALSYGVFSFGALFYSLREARPDVIITLTTPPLVSLIGSIVRWFRGSRHVIWEMDMFPEVLVSVGALKQKSWLNRLLQRVSNSSRRSAAAIIALGPCMKRRLVESGIAPERIHIVENWADGDAIRPASSRKPGVNVFYSGNLGVSHEIETILHGMEVLQDDPRFSFTFAGGGQLKDKLAAACSAKQLANVEFIPYASRESMSSHLATATIGLVTERPESLGTVVPSKVYGLMAAGKPILFIGPRAATPGLLIRRFGVGWQIEPGDGAGLVALLHRLADDPREIRRRGRRARRVFERHYDLPIAVRRLERLLLRGVEEVPGHAPTSVTPAQDVGM